MCRLRRCPPLALTSPCCFCFFCCCCAQFEIRQLRLDAARKILGTAIGMCPKVRGWRGVRMSVRAGRTGRGSVPRHSRRTNTPLPCSLARTHIPQTHPIHLSTPQNKLFKSYIELELTLGNIERCRTLYGKYLEWAPSNAGAWGR